MDWLIAIGLLVILFGAVTFFGAPYVPSQRRYVRRAFTDLYRLSKTDLLVDVGSGDGMVLRLARQHGAQAVGFEINPVLVVISRWLSRHDKGVRVELVNFWSRPLPEGTTVVYAFAVQRDVARLAKKIQAEADKVGRPLELLLYGSPLKGIVPDATLDAYCRYIFRPSQAKKVTL